MPYGYPGDIRANAITWKVINYARRKFALFANLMEHMGYEPGRLHFSWVSSAESTKFVDVVTQVTAAGQKAGPEYSPFKTQGQGSLNVRIC